MAGDGSSPGESALQLPSPEVVSQSFQLRGRSFNLLVLELAELDRNEYFTAFPIQFTATETARLTPVVLDLERYRQTLTLAEIVQRLRTVGIAPVAVQGGSQELQDESVKLGLPILPRLNSRRPDSSAEPIHHSSEPIHRSSSLPPATGQSQPVAPTWLGVAAPAGLAEQDRPSTEPPSLLTPETVVINTSVRAGQQVESRGDLVILGPVNTGAELCAAGNIHTYGALRGRASAGVNGDEAAQIFCLKLEAEWVSIASARCTVDEFCQNGESVFGKPCRIMLRNGRVCLRQMSSASEV